MTPDQLALVEAINTMLEGSGLPPYEPIKPREAALALGRSTYSTGKPCFKGHASARYVSGGACVACHSEYSKRYRPKKTGSLLQRS